MKLTLITIISLLIFPLFLSGLDYYWVNGNGDWTDINHWATTSGGTLKHIQTPTPADNVFFDVNSSTTDFTVNMNIPVVVCKDLKFDGLNKELTLSGVTNEIRAYGGLSLSDKVVWSIGAKFSFESQQLGNQISSNDCKMPLQVNFLSTSGGWILTDSLFTDGEVNLIAGAFNTNGKNVYIFKFSSLSQLSRSLSLGATIFKTRWFDVDGAGFYVNAGTSHIIMLNEFFKVDNCSPQVFYDLSFTVDGLLNNTNADLTFHYVRCSENASFYGNVTYDKLFLSKGYNYFFGIGTNHIFIVDLIANGSCDSRIGIKSIGMSTNFKKTSGSINVNFVILKGIAASGGASFNAWSSVDDGANSGWNIQAEPPRTLYWVGGSGDWEDSLHWSLTSGGVGGECIPTLIDDIIFNNSSFQGVGDSVQITDSAGNCHDMTWNTTLLPILAGDDTKFIRISGSMYFCPQMENLFEGDIMFVSQQLGEYVQTSNHKLLNNVIFDGRGSWTLLDTLVAENSISVSMGVFYTNNQFLHSKYFDASTIRWKELYLSTSIIEVEASVGIRQDSTFIDPGTSTFFMLDSNSFFRTDRYPHRNIWNLIFKEDGIIDSKQTHFHKIIYRKNIDKRNVLTVDSIFYTAGYDYLFSGTDTVIDYLEAKGYCTKKITFRVKNPMGIFNLVKQSGNITVERVHMRGIHAYGGASFIGVNCSDVGNNSGWTFINQGTNLYWIDGQGDWNDSLHWSYASGGTGGACIPTINDNVYFDSQSFSIPNETVNITSPNAFCHNMLWSTNIPNPIFSTPARSNLYIAGSITLSDAMKHDFFGPIYFCDTSLNKTITSKGNDFDTAVFFIDNGYWTLSDSMDVRSDIFLFSGNITTAGYKLRMETFNASFTFPKSLNITNSEVNVYDNNLGVWYWYQNPAASFTATNSNVYFRSPQNHLAMMGGGVVDFHNIFFIEPNAQSLFKANQSIQNFNNKVVFSSNGNLEGDHTYDTLILSAGKVYNLGGNNTQFINKLLKADGYCSKEIVIRGFGSTSNISKTNGIIEVHEASMKDIKGIGGAIFNAYAGHDNGGNINWNWYPNAPRTLYWVGCDGLWNDSAHWSLSSGGIGGECIPTRIDDVIIDSNSCNTKFFNSLLVDTYGECLNFLWNDQKNTDLSGNLHVFGALNIDKKINTVGLKLSFQAVSQNNLIKTGNNEMELVSFEGKGGWYLYDSLLVKDSIMFNRGFLDTRDQFVKTISFRSLSNSKKRLDMKNSTFSIRKRWLMNVDSLTLNAGTSNILYRDIGSSGSYSFYNIGKGNTHYYNVTIQDERVGKTYFYNIDSAIISFNKATVYNDGIFYNQYIFDSLMFAPGNTYKLQHDMEQKVLKHWQIRGNNCYAINLESTKMFSTAYTTKPDGFVSGDFINMRDIHSSGNCTYYAGAFSTDISNNSGWIFQNGPNYVYGLGYDTNFAIGSNVTLSTVNFNGTNTTLYQWSTGSTNDTIVVSQTGWYSVTVSYAVDCQVVDSVFVGCRIDLNYNISDNPCFGDTLGSIGVIVPDTSYQYSYIWNTGDTSDFIGPYPAGDYILTVVADSGKCMVVDTVKISEPPKVMLPQGDTAYCENDSVLLILGDFKYYFWDDGYTASTRWVAKPDTFFVFVEDSAGCRSDGDSIYVGVDSLPYVNLGFDTCISINQIFNLYPGSNFDAYLWENGSMDSVLDVYYPGIYWVTIRKNTCVITDSIILENCPPLLHMPNIFTPNGDGWNDYFSPEEDNILEFNMKIFNRWGMRIYQTTDLQYGWDGTTMGVPAAEGVYFYVIEYREWLGNEASEIYTAQGTVTLMRNQ